MVIQRIFRFKDIEDGLNFKQTFVNKHTFFAVDLFFSLFPFVKIRKLILIVPADR